MDIHKPKPWHNVREFLKEYAIIVIGVLTALGAEQAVERFNWAEKVRHGEAQEQAELQTLYFMAAERDQTESCLLRRLDQLKAALLANQGDWRPLPPMVSLGRSATVIVPGRAWPTEVWRSLLSDGTASHLRPERELDYANVYTQAAGLADRNAKENETVSALQLLENSLPLSNDKRADLIQQVEEERARVQGIAVSSRQTMNRAERITRIDKPLAQQAILKRSNTYRACAAMGLLPPGSPPPAALSAAELRQFGVRAP